VRAGTIDLRALELSPGAAADVRLPVPVEPMRLGGQPYRVDPQAPEARVDVSSSASGRAFRLRAAGELVGPCFRCLEEARSPLSVDAREFAAANRPPGAPFDDDLDCAYLERERLDVSAWLRDALAEELPATILCREDCPGLCPTCGASLAAGPCGCPPAAPDSRWGALAALAARLGDGEEAPSPDDPPPASEPPRPPRVR
jgi:uncharacterized protein